MFRKACASPIATSISVSILLIASAAANAQDVAAQALPPAASRLSETEATLCRACHRDYFDSTARGPHAVLDLPTWQQHAGVGGSCTACHGDVSAHVMAGGQAPVFTFDDATLPAQQAAVCGACHADFDTHAEAAPHSSSGLSCTTCHSQHSSPQRGPALLKYPDAAAIEPALGAASAVCLTCHAGERAEFSLNERHRLREGILDCTSCHDPHGKDERASLFAPSTANCGSCHADKDGPFVFEHGASRVEGCTACHSPHGSPNRHMLTHQRTAEICYSCHATVPQFHAGFGAGAPRFGLDTQCTNCHVTIHGSNLDPYFLK